MDADFFPAFDLHNLTFMDNNLDRTKLNSGDSAQNFLADIAGDRVLILWCRVVCHDAEQSMFSGARMYQFPFIIGTNKSSFVYHFFEYTNSVTFAVGKNADRREKTDLR
jgi:hypothetical protein